LAAGDQYLLGQYFLGIDGGATRCRARLRDSSGAVMAESIGPAANIYVDYASALAAVRSVVAEVFAHARFHAAGGERVALGLGLAGLSTGVEAERIIADLSADGAFTTIRAANDAVTACLGAHGGADGGLVIAGTGSAGIARVGGTETVIGGRGFLLGDDGAAARIGADAMRAAIRAFDGLGPTTPLTENLMRKFADDPLKALQWALGASPGDYGAFAPLVLEAASSGDSVGSAVVAAAVAALARLTHAVRALGAEKIALVGGLGAGIRAHFPPDLAALLRRPLFDATDGAILLAGGVLPDAAGSDA
jgi:glucosamine kinase